MSWHVIGDSMADDLALALEREFDDLEVSYASSSGGRCIDMLDDLASQLDETADLTIVECGTNDAIRNSYDIDATANAIQTVAETVLGLGQEVILHAPIPIRNEVNHCRFIGLEGCNANMLEIGAAMQTMADDFGVRATRADSYHAFIEDPRYDESLGGPSLYKPDFIHCSMDEGCALMAHTTYGAAPVPEPAGAPTLGVALALLAILARWRRRRR